MESLSISDRTLSSVLGFVTVKLEAMNSRENEQIFLRDDSINLPAFGNERTALFIKNSDTEHTSDAVVSMLYTQLFQQLVREADKQQDGRLKVPCHLILDDFGATSSCIAEFDRNISTVRSRDIYISIMIQSLSQLQSMYNSYSAKTIINNCDTILFMGCNDMETARMIADRADKTPNKIANLPRDKAYLIVSGEEKALLVDKIEPYSMVP